MNLTTSHSLWLAPLCLLLGILYAWVQYQRADHRHGWSRQLNYVLAALRALAVALIAFFLLEPMVRVLLREERKPVVVVAHDASASLLAAGDTTAMRSAYPDALRKLVAQLGEKYEVRPFSYGQEVQEGLNFEQLDGQTDMDQLLREVYDRFSGPDIGAVIMDGDGIYNRGRDPRYQAQKLGVPVFTIALGDTTVRPDLLVKGVDHNRITYLGNEFPVVVRVEARHLAGKHTRVSVLHDGKEAAGKDITVGGDPFFTEVPLLVKASAVGLQRYTVQIDEVEGEATGTNNSLGIFVDVLDDRRKILILALNPHPDVAALRQALDGLEGYGTEVAYASTFTGKADDYDLIILHQLPSAKASIQPLLQRCTERGIPLCVVLGENSDFNQVMTMGTGVEATGMQRMYTDAQAAVNKDFTLFTFEPDDQHAFERFPPLQVPFGTYELDKNASALMTQKIGVIRSDYPLIAFRQDGERHIATICGEGLWRWRLADQQQNATHAHFDKLIHKIVQFLALKADKRRFRVSHSPQFNEGEPVVIAAELYNKSYEPVNTPSAVIALKDEEGKEYPYTFSQAGNAYRLDAGELPAGKYTWKASAELDGEELSDTGELLVQPLVAELLSTVADHALLADLSAKTQGIMVHANELDRLAEAIAARKEIVTRSYAQPTFSDLIDLKWIFFVLLALLTLEWALRRRSGAY